VFAVAIVSVVPPPASTMIVAGQPRLVSTAVSLVNNAAASIGAVPAAMRNMSASLLRGAPRPPLTGMWLRCMPCQKVFQTDASFVAHQKAIRGDSRKSGPVSRFFDSAPPFNP